VRIKLDENVPLRLAAMLEGRGQEVDTVQQEGLTGRPDAQIAAAARAAGRMVVTVDRGFPAFADRAREHPGVIVFKLPDQDAPHVEVALAQLLSRYALDELVGCTVVVTPARIRIRRPEDFEKVTHD